MKKDIVKEVRTELVETLDKETGEVEFVSEKRIKVLVDPDSFSLVYAGLWNVLIESNLNKSDINLLAFLLSNYVDGTPFSITSYIKKLLAKKTGKSPTSFNNSTAKLLRSKFIYEVDKRVYKINPRYAYAGSSKDRKRAVIEMFDFCIDC